MSDVAPRPFFLTRYMKITNATQFCQYFIVYRMFQLIKGFIKFNFDFFFILLGGAADIDYSPFTIYHGWKQYSTCGCSGLKAEIAHEFLHKTAGICRYGIRRKRHCFIAQCFAHYSELQFLFLIISFISLTQIVNVQTKYFLMDS